MTILSPQKNKWNLSGTRFRIFVFNLRIMQIKVMKKCQVAYVNQMKTIKQFKGYKTVKTEKGKINNHERHTCGEFLSLYMSFRRIQDFYKVRTRCQTHQAPLQSGPDLYFVIMHWHIKGMSAWRGQQTFLLKVKYGRILKQYISEEIFHQ